MAAITRMKYALPVELRLSGYVKTEARLRSCDAANRIRWSNKLAETSLKARSNFNWSAGPPRISLSLAAHCAFEGAKLLLEEIEIGCEACSGTVFPPVNFDLVQDVKVTKDKLDPAKHIANQKAGNLSRRNARITLRQLSSTSSTGSAPVSRSDPRSAHGKRTSST